VSYTYVVGGEAPPTYWVPVPPAQPLAVHNPVKVPDTCLGVVTVAVVSASPLPDNKENREIMDTTVMYPVCNFLKDILKNLSLVQGTIRMP
jgi:hypothetical protein